MADALALTVRVDETLRFETTLPVFLAANAEVIDPATAQDIADTLRAGRRYRGGGLHQPCWELIPANQPPEEPEPRSGEHRGGLRGDTDLQPFCLEDEPFTITSPERMPLGQLLAAMGDDAYVDIRAIGYCRDRESNPRPMVLVTVNKAAVLMTPARANADAAAMACLPQDPAFKRALVIRSSLKQAAARAGAL
jgi:hypothetical protein